MYKKRNDNIVFILVYTFNRVLCETSYVIGFFLTIMKKKLKQNVTIESLNHILVMFSFVNYNQIHKKKTLASIIVRWRLGFCFVVFSLCNT
jgi:hypothetical protein